MTRRHLALALATATLATAVPATAQPTLASDAAEEPIPITDPVLLESLGFEPDATNVYAMPQALREMAMDPAERAAAQATPVEDVEPRSPFGTSTFGYSPVLGTEFYPYSNSSDYRTLSNSERYCYSGHPDYTAQIDSLPHGAELWYVSLWLYDTSTTHDIDVALYRTCQPNNNPSSPSVVVLRTVSTTGSGGSQYLRMGAGSPINETIDLESCAYSLRAQFGNPLPAQCMGLAGLRIQKARAQWTRQISPAPATATFNDVPTGHPFFQHIEALAASEITGGCGGGNFCPNQPLTRGQMAVFLATALGLHWGSF